ncbi:hypothetical protein WQQ_29080 [Hydrocarboniphaga effusa AP103]|uniref:Uncharacterized protein n=1 Tax=Hydrocarboniphaga effusa AP103 TaxID=1172194 RepID=I8I046_9GAMM|nr:hypothetical protein WQQ_29080 [Hydrocarboniphaga effusa AP103]
MLGRHFHFAYPHDRDDRRARRLGSACVSSIKRACQFDDAQWRQGLGRCDDVSAAAVFG